MDAFDPVFNDIENETALPIGHGGVHARRLGPVSEQDPLVPEA